MKHNLLCTDADITARQALLGSLQVWSTCQPRTVLTCLLENQVFEVINDEEITAYITELSILGHNLK
jgi:hypothetical protein